MSNKPGKYCIKFPCSNLAVNGAHCPAHRPARAPKETEPFYLSVRWRRFREWYIGRHPLCEVCEREGRGAVPASMVDHIIEIKDGGALTSEDNAESKCWKCHGIKTASEKDRRKNHQQSCEDNRVVSTEDTYYG